MNETDENKLRPYFPLVTCHAERLEFLNLLLLFKFHCFGLSLNNATDWELGLLLLRVIHDLLLMTFESSQTRRRREWGWGAGGVPCLCVVSVRDDSCEQRQIPLPPHKPSTSLLIQALMSITWYIKVVHHIAIYLPSPSLFVLNDVSKCDNRYPCIKCKGALQSCWLHWPG